jgi:hypothetical protein
MPSADPGAPPVRPADVERWLADLALVPVERAEGITSWDLVLDGRRRFDLRVTLILDPSFALLVWAPFAPPINDMFRKSYRRLLRWNDAFPFVKFGLTEDERPLLAAELPIESVDGAAVGLALARVVGIADRLFEDTVPWLWIGGKRPDQSKRTPRNERFLREYADVLADLDDVPLGAAATADDEAPDTHDPTADDSTADDLTATDADDAATQSAGAAPR